MPPKKSSVDDDNDPDLAGGGKPRNQYEATNAPLTANIADQRRVEDDAAGRDQLRERVRTQLRPNQKRVGGAIYNVPGELAGINPVQAAEPNYVEMQLMDASRAATSAELAQGGSERVDDQNGGSQYEVVPNGELISHIITLEDAVTSLKAEADAAQKAQNAQAAHAVRMRRYTILNSVLGGVSLLSAVGAILFAYFTRPQESTGPVAMNVDGGDNLDLAKGGSVDVASRAMAGKGGASINKASVELTTYDDGNNRMLTVADIGVWTVDGSGIIKFAPDAKFEGGPVSIIYTIADTTGARSARAQVFFNFARRAQAATGGPVAQDFEQTHTVADVVVIDVGGAAKPGPSGAAIKLDSIALDGATAAKPKEVFQRGVGTWTAGDDGKISFKPIEGFTGGPALQVYTISDVNGTASQRASISLGFYMRAKVFDVVVPVAAFTGGAAISVNLVDGSADYGKPIADKGLTIDAASVIITGVVTNEGEARGPDATGSGNMKRLVVDGEGTWDATSATGVVTFTPGATLTVDPHSVTYQVADSKGGFSNVAKLTLSAAATKVIAALGAINALDDQTFWTMFETTVVKADLGSDPVGALVLLRAVTTELWLNTRDGLDAGTRDSVLTRRDALLRGVLTPDFDVWRKNSPGDPDKPLSPERLLRLSKAYDDAKVALPGVRLATRYVRLSYIDMMLGYFVRYMDNLNN